MFVVMRRATARPVGLFIVVVTGAMLWAGLYHYQSIDRMSPGVLAWWTGLCVISILNVCLWRYSALALPEHQEVDPAVYRFKRRQLVLAAIFVFGCAFRALVPRGDVQRIGIVDSWLSTVLVGRSVATVAELAFAAQWALVINQIAVHVRWRPGEILSWLLVPLLCVAEGFSWYSVLSTSYLGNVIEESIWTLSAILAVISFLAMARRCSGWHRRFVVTAALLGACYIVFMVTVDVPMYLTRWQADCESGRPLLSLAQGIWDAGSRWVVDHSWDEWHSEMPWMSLYFSVCVWCSLALNHLPPAENSEQAVASEKLFASQLS